MLHGLLNLGGLLALLASLVVMYRVKETHGRPHWWSAGASWHAASGAACVALLLLVSAGAVRAMPLGCGLAAVARSGRGHKRAGRALLLALLAVVASGWSKLYADDPARMLPMLAGLAAIGLCVVWPQRAAPKHD